MTKTTHPPLEDTPPVDRTGIPLSAIEKRKAELKAEFESGQKMMLDLDAKRSDLQTTLLRISGAIQVCEEMLQAPAENEQ